MLDQSQRQLWLICNPAQRRNARRVAATALFVLLFGISSHGAAQWQLDVETGPVFNGYNDVRIPNETGTKFSLSEDLGIDAKIFYRLRLTYQINDRHALSVLAAPLQLDVAGVTDRSIIFAGAEFPTGAPLDGIYRFDSYRLTYRYGIHRNAKTRIDIGFTAKIRNAEVSLQGGGAQAEKNNTGFVPLLHFRFDWMFTNRMRLLFEGDALAAPQGRAEDILLAIHYRPVERIGFKAGYRILEGGADVDEVYTFALLHYLVFGAIISF